MAVLDEISGFASEVATGNEQGKTADNIYKAFRGTVDSRFPDLGKVVLLSFPRYPGDFISQRYDAVIAEKEIVDKTHKFIINEDLPEDHPDNSFEIAWEEDHILSYKIPKVLALKRPTWDVNPTRKIDDFKIAFLTDLGDAMMRFLCTPTYASDAFFKQKDKLIKCMTLTNPVDSFRRFSENFKPDPDKIYYVHADLAQKHDKCAVAIAHVDKWVDIQVINCWTNALRPSEPSLLGSSIRLLSWNLPSRVVPNKLAIDATPKEVSHLFLPVKCEFNWQP